MTCTLKRGPIPRLMFNGLKNPPRREETPGWVCPPFGVHRDEILQGYTLTHMPSGLAVRYSLRSLTEARRIIGQLLALPISWRWRNPNRLKKAVREQILMAAERPPHRRSHDHLPPRPPGPGGARDRRRREMGE